MTGVSVEGIRRSSSRAASQIIMDRLGVLADPKKLVKELKRVNSSEVESMLVAALIKRGIQLKDELKTSLKTMRPEFLLEEIKMIATLKDAVIGLLREGKIQSEDSITALRKGFSIGPGEL